MMPSYVQNTNSTNYGMCRKALTFLFPDAFFEMSIIKFILKIMWVSLFLLLYSWLVYCWSGSDKTLFTNIKIHFLMGTFFIIAPPVPQLLWNHFYLPAIAFPEGLLLASLPLISAYSVNMPLKPITSVLFTQKCCCLWLVPIIRGQGRRELFQTCRSHATEPISFLVPSHLTTCRGPGYLYPDHGEGFSRWQMLVFERCFTLFLFEDKVQIYSRNGRVWAPCTFKTALLHLRRTDWGHTEIKVISESESPFVRWSTHLRHGHSRTLKNLLKI